MNYDSGDIEYLLGPFNCLMSSDKVGKFRYNCQTGNLFRDFDSGVTQIIYKTTGIPWVECRGDSWEPWTKSEEWLDPMDYEHPSEVYRIMICIGDCCEAFTNIIFPTREAAIEVANNVPWDWEGSVLADLRKLLDRTSPKPIEDNGDDIGF